WHPGGDLRWNPGWLGGAVVVLAVLNGLTPYTETKTAYGFNMYANLVTAQGNSNHYLIDRTFRLRNGYDHPVEIVESSDPGLQLYAERGYFVAYPQLRRYLSSRPSVGLTYSRASALATTPRADQVPELVDPGPWWWRFLPLRALDQNDPPRCQDVFLPAL
ncbi:MAG: hypothetical protein ACRDWA_14820, partial [Acidimicrobiia bacterium]